MTLTLTIWILLFITFSVLSLRRSSWGICLYMLTYFITPYWWWWGRPLLQMGYLSLNLWAALILAGAVLLDARPRSREVNPAPGRVCWFLLFYGINAIVIHYLAASNPAKSYAALELLWKQIGLFVLILLAIRDEFDLKLMIYAILGGALYLGYEIVLNGRGGFHEGRLAIPLYNIGDENYLAGLLSLAAVLGGYLLLMGKRLEKLFALVTLPLVLDVIIRCNSRGAFLALIAGAVWLVIRARGPIRRYALAGIALAGIGAYFLMGDPEIMERFATTFVSSEERDASARGRIAMWTQGVNMVTDYPLGSGGEAAFKSNRGLSYLRKIGKDVYFAVHNGYIDIAASWGIQGFLLYMTIIFICWLRLRRAVLAARAAGNRRLAFMGVCLEAALITQLGSAMFISSLDGEWFFWWMAMALCYGRVFYPEGVVTEEEEEDWEDFDDAEYDDWEPDGAGEPAREPVLS